MKAKKTTRKKALKLDKRTQKKQRAFKDSVKQMIDATKSALRKRKAEEEEEKQRACDESQRDDEEQPKKKRSSKSGEAQISFFYTNDKYFTQFDDNEIIQSVRQKYPDFMKEGISDIDLKRTIICILQDKNFVDSVLEFYNLSVQDFFKFMFRRDTTIFKGPYLSKLQKVIQESGYKI